MAECRTCQAPIRFEPTVHGSVMPLDAEPAADGNVRLTDDGAAVLGPLELELARAEGETLYLPHFATCPDAEEHRRG